MKNPKITGHTGNEKTADNSLDSVFKSIELQADAFEVDVRQDKEANLVLSHNEKSQVEYESCHRLAEVFEIMRVNPGIQINCDLKVDDLPLEVIRLASDFGVGADRLILTGIVSLPYLEKYPEILRMADIYMNAENILEEIYFQIVPEGEERITRPEYYRNPWKYLRKVISSLDPYIGMLSDRCLASGVKGINLPFLCVSDDNLREFREKGIPVSVWTVNEEKEIYRFLSRGVENLTTRSVMAAKSVRKSLYGF